MRRIFSLWLACFAALSMKGQISISSVSHTEDATNPLRYDIDMSLSPAARAYVEYKYFDGTDTVKAFTSVSASGSNPSLRVVGLRPLTTYEYRPIAFDGSGAKAGTWASFTTDSIPQSTLGVLNMDSVYTAPGYDAQGYVLTDKLFGSPAKTVQVYDRKGGLVWYDTYPGNVASDARCMQYAFSDHNTLLLLECHRLTELDWMGNVLREIDYDTADYLHHDAIWTQDGDIAVVYSEGQIVDKSSVGGDPNSLVVGQGILVTDSTGTEEWRWSSFDHLDPLESPDPGGFWTPIFGPQAINWLHCNSLDEDVDGYFLMSYRLTSQLVKIHPTNGLLLWTLGTDGDIDIPVTDTFKLQHSFTRIADSDNYLVYDNTGLDSLTRVMEFFIDFSYLVPLMTKKWEFVVPQAYFSDFVSNVKRLENGHTFLGNGASQSLMEVDAQGNMMWFGLMDGQFYRGYVVDDFYKRAELEYTGPLVVCVDESAAALSATPSGGWWSGNHVNGSTFDGVSAGLGTHTIYYHFGPQIDTIDIEVQSQPQCLVALDEATAANFKAFPNPFRESLRVRFEQFAPAAVTLEVYGLEGRLLRQLSLPAGPTGTREMELSAEGLPSGILLLRLQVEGQPAMTRRVSLMR